MTPKKFAILAAQFSLIGALIALISVFLGALLAYYNDISFQATSIAIALIVLGLLAFTLRKYRVRVMPRLCPKCGEEFGVDCQGCGGER